MTKIRNKGIEWDVNDYNERLGKENDILEEIEGRKIKLLEEERKRINEVWKK